MIHHGQYDEIIRHCLEEDLGVAGDITSAAVIDATALAEGSLVARQSGVVAGMEVASRVFETVDRAVELRVEVGDGSFVERGAVVGIVSGPTRSVLSGERTALNLIGRMSGVATATRRLVDLVAGTRAVIADTRKTMPGLRVLDKWAVRLGGGVNHRFGLGDAVMIKDNHLVAAGGVRRAVEAARAKVGHTVRIEVEVSSLQQLEELLEVGADIVMLDNMDVTTMARAVELVSGRMKVEASGAITAENIRAVAETGVDVISVGWITHSAPQLDLALDF